MIEKLALFGDYETEPFFLVSMTCSLPKLTAVNIYIRAPRIESWTREIPKEYQAYWSNMVSGPDM